MILGSLAAPVLAQDAVPAGRPARGSYGFVTTLERKVGLSPEQRDAVRGLLAEQRQKTQAVRDATDDKIRGLLNSEQQKKFDAMLADQKANRNKKKAGA